MGSSEVGEVTIHSTEASETAAQEAAEKEADERIFGRLPAEQGEYWRDRWEEVEDSEKDEAIFAKSIDSVQEVISNLEAGGASWIDYNVTRDQLESRVAGKVKRGAPAIWDALKLRIDDWFAK